MIADSILPTDATARKAIPLATGLLDYFPSALAAVAAVSKAGNDQHNPGQPLHWSRGKSMDQADTLLRHLLERGTVDHDGLRHSAKMAWRALALLQIELEEAGAPQARGAWIDPPSPPSPPDDPGLVAALDMERRNVVMREALELDDARLEALQQEIDHRLLQRAGGTRKKKGRR
jgi:hypothetical protein